MRLAMIDGNGLTNEKEETMKLRLSMMVEDNEGRTISSCELVCLEREVLSAATLGLTLAGVACPFGEKRK